MKPTKQLSAVHLMKALNFTYVDEIYSITIQIPVDAVYYAIYSDVVI